LLLSCTSEQIFGIYSKCIFDISNVDGTQSGDIQCK